MGLVIVKLKSRGGVEKQDASLKYESCGDEGDAACIVGCNSDDQLSHHNVMEEEPSATQSKINILFSCLEQLNW